MGRKTVTATPITGTINIDVSQYIMVSHLWSRLEDLNALISSPSRADFHLVCCWLDDVAISLLLDVLFAKIGVTNVGASPGDAILRTYGVALLVST